MESETIEKTFYHVKHQHSVGELGRILVREMNRLKISQGELGRRTKLCKQEISHMVLGQRYLGPEVANRLAKELDLDPKVLLIASAKDKMRDYEEKQ